MSTHVGTDPRRRNAPRGLRLLIPIGWFVVAFATHAGAQIRPIDLGTLGGEGSVATAINASGQVVGYSGTAGGEAHAFSWTPAGGMIDLGTLGGARSIAVAVNPRGQVVGHSGTAGGETHAFSWTPAGGMIDLGTLGDEFSTALAVNANGQVVGYSSTGPSTAHAFSWTPAGGMIDLGTLGGEFSTATAVNANGQVVGYSTTGSSPGRAFSWTPAGGMIDLGTFGDIDETIGASSIATDVNANGQVVGASTPTLNFPDNAFSWTAPGGMVNLGNLGGSSIAEAVNPSGQVVGYSATVVGYDATSSAFRAFSWDEAGGMVDLGSEEESSRATAVNASGQVIGYSYTYRTIEGRPQRWHPFSWTAKEGMIRLSSLGGLSSHAVAVNDKGQAVGWSSRADGAIHAALWTVVADTLPPIADTFVRASLSSANFGDAPTIRVKKGTTRRPYLKFDISQITEGDRVTLRLHGNASDATGPVSATVYAVADTSWHEHTLTWNTRPALGKVLGSVTVGAPAAQWVYVDVTKFVQAERRAGRNVISLALRSVVPSSAFAEFQSREAGDTGPRLVITR